MSGPGRQGQVLASFERVRGQVGGRVDDTTATAATASAVLNVIPRELHEPVGHYANMSTEMDRYLWEKSAAGDPAAFGEIFQRHARAVYNYLFRRCGDWATAEDLTSIVFLEAWRRRGEVTLVNDSALPYLLGVAVNVLRNRWRAELRYRAALKRLPPAAEGPDHGDNVVDRLEDERIMRNVLQAFSRLPKREQDVVSLCVWAGLTYEEAATALDIPVGTVRSRLSRGRERLRELIGGIGHEGTGNAETHVGQEVTQ